MVQHNSNSRHGSQACVLCMQKVAHNTCYTSAASSYSVSCKQAKMHTSRPGQLMIKFAGNAISPPHTLRLMCQQRCPRPGPALHEAQSLAA
jgi:hypothetical protein